MAKIHIANAEGREVVEIWGSGKPRREFMHSDDVASAILFLLRHYSEEKTINVGVGHDFSIREMAEKLAGVIGWSGKFVFNASYPDGTPQRLLDSRRISTLGWRPSIDINQGLKSAYNWFLANKAKFDVGREEEVG